MQLRIFPTVEAPSQARRELSLDGLVEAWKADEREKQIWFCMNVCSS